MSGLLKTLCCRAFGGIFDIGTLAGQVKNPRKDILLATIALICIALTEFLLPLALAVSVDPNLSHYEEGYYAVIADIIAGKWLQILVTISAINTQVGGCNSAALVSDSALQSIVLLRLQDKIDGFARSEHKLVRYMFHYSEERVAPVFTVINSAIIAGFVLVPFESVIALGLLLQNTSILLLCISFVKLKYTEPTANWVYGTSVFKAVLFTIFPLVAVCSTSYFVLFDFPAQFGLKYFNLILYISTIALGLLVHAVFRFGIGRFSHVRKASSTLCTVEFHPFRLASSASRLKRDG